jgi:hypothetical protein
MIMLDADARRMKESKSAGNARGWTKTEILQEPLRSFH